MLPPLPKRYFESETCQRTFDYLFLTDSDLRVLWHSFRQLRATDGDRSIRILDLLRSAGLAPTPFAQATLSIADVDGRRTVTFREFVICIWNFLTLDKAQMVSFAWDVLLAQTLGEDLELANLRQLIEDTLGSTLSRKSRTFINEAVARAPHVGVSGRQFYFLCQKDKQILSPAMYMQGHLTHKVGGHRFWKHASEKRHILANNMSWRDIIKALHPTIRAHPTSLPAVTGVIPPKQGREGDEAVLKRRAEELKELRKGGMAKVAMTDGKGKMEVAGPRSNNPFPGKKAVTAAGVGGAATSRGGTGLSAMQVGELSRDRSGSRRSLGGSTARGLPIVDPGQESKTAAQMLEEASTVREGFTAAQAAALIRQAAAGEQFSVAARRRGGGKASKLPAAAPLNPQAVKFLMPGVVHVEGADVGQDGPWPTNPATALARQFGVPAAQAHSLGQNHSLHGYLRRARKHNMPVYTLHTRSGTSAAQFSTPGVVDGIRGRWRHARVPESDADRTKVGYRKAKGGGFFSGCYCCGANHELDDMWDAEIIRIGATKTDAEKKGQAAEEAAQRERQQARDAAERKEIAETVGVRQGDAAKRAAMVAQGASLTGAAVAAPPTYKLEGYNTLERKTRQLQREMEADLETQEARQERAVERLQQVEDEASREREKQGALGGRPGTAAATAAGGARSSSSAAARATTMTTATAASSKRAAAALQAAGEEGAVEAP